MDDIKIVSGASAIGRLGPLWREVSNASGGLGAFESFDLVCGAAKIADRSGQEPLVVVFSRHGQVTSLLPLSAGRFIGARAAVSLVHPLAQYTDVIGAPLDRREFACMSSKLAGHGIDLLLLHKVPATGGLHDALRAHGASQRAPETSLYIDLAAFGTFEAYDATFSRVTRRSRNRRRQKLVSCTGPLSFEALRGAEAVPTFETALDWKRRWLAERGASSPVFDKGPWEDLLRQMVASGAATVFALRGGNRIVSAEVGFEDRTTYVSYLGAYDPSLCEASPGQEQMRRTIAWCFDQGFKRYDLLAPTDDYKYQWARNETGVSLDDYTVSLTAVGRGVAEVRRHVRPVAREIYRRLPTEMRLAGERYGMPAAAAAVVMCASAVIVAIT